MRLIRNLTVKQPNVNNYGVTTHHGAPVHKKYKIKKSQASINANVSDFLTGWAVHHKQSAVRRGIEPLFSP